MKKLLFRWNELKATFWFVPVIILTSSVILAMGLLYLDSIVEFHPEGPGRFFFVSSSDSARSILSTISGAMMGVAGTVFSITLVALTLASSQFGPRLIKKFMYVRLNQVVLGSYISTYLYCLLVLNAIKEGDDFTFIPSIAIIAAIGAAVINIVLLIVFIHQIAISIQADKVVADISSFLSGQIETLFPERMGEELERDDNIDTSVAISTYMTRTSVKCPKNGYLQYVDSEALMETVSKNDAFLTLHYRPGAHLLPGVELAVLHTHDKWGDEKLKKLMGHIVIGKTKTAQQDLEYSIHQMVEIAARALSPGVNDPYTAIACVDNLASTMAYLAQAKFPSKYRYDEQGTLRIYADALEFEGVLDAAFNQIRQFSGGSPSVIIRLMEALSTILSLTKDESRRKAVLRHASMVLNIGKQTIKEENDLQDLKERAEKILGF